MRSIFGYIGYPIKITRRNTMTTDELRESLLYAPKNGYSEYTP